MKKIFIIGSGISGLSSAHYLVSKGFNVTILDKGKYPGGRISTRRIQNFIFNHGAQFFTAKSENFSAVCQEAKNHGVLKKWITQKNKNVFIGFPDMREFCLWLAKDLKIYQSTAVNKIKFNKNIEIYTNHKIFFCDGIILTPPALQTSDLIKELDTKLSNKILDVSYFPCWSLMLGLNKKIGSQFNSIKNNYFDWIISENHKIDNFNLNNCLTLHASDNYSKKNINANKTKVMDELIIELCKIYNFNKSDFIYKNIHKWRFSQVENPFDVKESKVSKKLPLAISGDWCSTIFDNYVGKEQRIEDAFLSGIQSSQELIDNYF